MSNLLTLFGNSKFQPQNIYNMKLWLDSSDLSTITKDGSNKISQWNDKSGLGNHATQGTGTKQPTWTASQLNSKPTVYFDNTDTLAVSSASLYAVANGGNTCFAVAKNSNASGVTDYVWHMSEAGSGRNYLAYLPTEGSIRSQSRTLDSNGVSYTTSVNNAYQVIRTRRSGTTQAIAVNGSAETTNAFGADEDGVDAFYLGSRANIDSFLDGYIAEILIYSRVLSSHEIALVERYLANKWAIH